MYKFRQRNPIFSEVPKVDLFDFGTKLFNCKIFIFSDMFSPFNNIITIIKTTPAKIREMYSHFAWSVSVRQGGWISVSVSLRPSPSLPPYLGPGVVCLVAREGWKWTKINFRTGLMALQITLMLWYWIYNWARLVNWILQHKTRKKDNNAWNIIMNLWNVYQDT